MKTHIPIWAGVECTVNRVGDTFFHQLLKNGHDKRIQDLERFAALGIERIRYPFIWETAATDSSPDQFDWSWADARTAELKRVGLTPIAGLVHHGSGPKSTSLLDPEFPEKLAVYARAFAERFPWIDDYTPVNEPLTTARFSGLYGVWYPHEKSDQSFVRALYNEIKGTKLAMKEIRKINPKARLIQTEDMGRAQGTSSLQNQIKFENNRRWLSFDLLCGTITPEHYMYEYLIQRGGLCPAELTWMSENPCPPNVIGLNHYPLSNRFLDDRLQFYPEEFHGGNGFQSYADVGAVDTTAATLPTVDSILHETWNRYHLPVAITEIHLLGTREDQMRWFRQVTDGALKAKAEGVDVHAVTAWSLLGSFDWNSLCTANRNYYESGIFDIRAPEPRPTALCRMVESFAKGERYQHPVLEEPGWWSHRDRAPFGPRLQHKPVKTKASTQPLLITGAKGTLGRAFARVCERRNIPYRALSRQEMEIAEFRSVQKAIDEIRPWAVINTAGYVRVDEAETDHERCYRENVEGPKNLAEMCSRKNIPLVHFSSDLVFDGSSQAPYVESDPVAPVNIYGQTKVESEKHVLDIHPQSLVVRTSSFFGPWDESNFVFSVIKSMGSGRSIHPANDITISPTYVPDLADICLDLLIDGEVGLLHLINEGFLTWADLAKLTAEMALEKKMIPEHLWSAERILPKSSSELDYKAKRPSFSALRSERIQILPNYEEALQRYFRDLEISLNETKELTLETTL
jgi:dTDP-4-dehydrorhamnose reductase